MRTKTVGGKRKPSKSMPGSSSSVSSPPIPYQDEADDEEYHVDDNGIFEGIGSSQDNASNNSDVDGKEDDFIDVEDEDDNVVVEDSFGDKDEFAGADCLFRDCLGGEFSYKCEGRRSQLLVCSENGCPVAMHEVCMIMEPTFDDTGKFYCPYCWYRREVVRTNELRREALLAKRDLSNFKQSKRDGGNKKKHEDGAVDVKEESLSTMEGKNDSGNHEQTVCVESVGEGKSDDGSISIGHGFDNVANGQIMQEEDIENASDSENDGSGIDDSRSVLEDNQGKRGKEESVFPNAVGTSMALITKDATSKVPAIESFEFVSPDLDAGTLVVRKKRIKHTAQKARPRKVDSPKNPSFQPSTSPKEMEIYQQGKATSTTAKSSVQCQELTKQIMNPTLGYGKRRRLNWMTEEEDMLKEGVQRFSLTMNKNIPWRKILEFGHKVFDNNRVPTDLKDKWKKIMVKEDPKCDKGTLVKFEE